MKKMESRLLYFDDFILPAIKDAGLRDENVTVEKSAYLHLETGNEWGIYYKIFGLGGTGSAQISRGYNKETDEIYVEVLNRTENKKSNCFTYKEVVAALKNLVAEPMANGTCTEIPF